MLFCSIEFIFLFMPIFLLIYYTVPEKYGNLILFLGSLFFYAYGEHRFFWLILVSLVIHYALTRYSQGKSRKCQRICLVVMLVYGFGMLFIFKYMDSFVANWNHLAVWLADRGSSVKLPHVNAPEVSLPLGISFYTFQIAAYAIDVYRGQVKPEERFVDLGAFLSMFPQLIAGPIVLYHDVSAQLGYTFQIYFDFQGYSMMAMGLGEMLGFRIPRNFRHPYMATSVTDFWRRWHMTLSGGFKNYVYIPLGGSRHGKVRMLFNMFVVWSLTGLWHGAGWNFILWGMYYFSLLMIEKLFLLRFFEKYPVVGWCFTFPAVVTGWVIFASDNLSAVKTYLMQMFGHLSDAGYWTMNLDLFEQTVRQYGIYLVLAFIFSTPWPYGKYRENKNRPLTILILLVLFGLCVYKMQTAASNPFLYFRF